MKKFASFLLVICIIISLCPLAVFAQDEVSVDEFAAEAANNANSWRYTNGVPRDDLEEATPYMTIPSVTKPANATKIGIDVSEWQGTIDWEKAKADGVEFAILRVGYGMNDTAQDDKYFEYNADECERLGIPYGVYIYSYATSTSRASSEADHVLRLIEGRNLSFPVYYDMEDISTLEYNLASIATTFCNKISAAGYPVGIYANLNWWNNYLTASCFDNWHKWVAQFNNTCHYTGTYAMWQCSSSGTVNGISGRVDMNYLIGSPADHGTAIESYLRTNKNTYTYGEPILTTANSTHSDAWVAIYKADDIISGSGDSPSSFYWYYVRGNGAEYGRGDLSWTPGVAYNIISKDSVICSHRAINGSPITGPLPVGTYKVSLMYGDYTVESSKTITITDALYTDKTTYEIGESIFVTANSSVNGAWVGLYKNGETPGTGADCVSSILWYYTADLSNPVDITKSNSKIEHPRPDDFGAGSYTLHLFGDNGYNNIVASVDFTISTHTHTPAAAVEENRVEPTDSKEGSYDSVIYCSVCNEELSRTTITIPASGSSAPSLAIARISGNGRCETAIEAANVLKAKQGVEKFNAIILASGNTFADALPGSYLAAVKNAPILLHRANRTVLNKEYISTIWLKTVLSICWAALPQFPHP